jgi:hypothetical protein
MRRANARVISWAAVASVLMLLALPRAAEAQGQSFRYPCSSGAAVVGLDGWQGWWMDGLRAICAPIDVVSGQVAGGRAATPVAGRVNGSTLQPRCPNGTVLTGYTGSRGTYVNYVHEIRCSRITPGGMAETGTFVSAFPRLANATGNFMARDCTGGRVVTAITGQAATYLDNFDVECNLLPGATAQTQTTTSTNTLERPSTTELAPRTAIMTPAAVTLVSPQSGVRMRGYDANDPCATMDVIPPLRWQAVTGAERYVVELRNTTRNTVRRFNATTTQQNSTQLRLMAGNGYSWRVQGVNALGNAGAWSAANTIIVVAPTPSGGGTCTVSPTAYPIF